MALITSQDELREWIERQEWYKEHQKVQDILKKATPGLAVPEEDK